MEFIVFLNVILILLGASVYDQDKEKQKEFKNVMSFRGKNVSTGRLYKPLAEKHMCRCSAKSFICNRDVCEEDVHYCDTKEWICRRCDEYLEDCYDKEKLKRNCTSVCADDLRSKTERQTTNQLRMQPCMSIPEIVNGHHNGSYGKFSNGEVVVFTCDDKYRLIGAKSVSCGDFGGWSDSPPTCDGIRVQPCMSIPKLGNGQHNGTFGNFSNGEVVAFICDNKYRLIGVETAMCGDFGVWSASLPICEPIQGDVPSNTYISIAVNIALGILLILSNVSNAKRLWEYLRKNKNRDGNDSLGSSDSGMDPYQGAEPGREPELVPNNPDAIPLSHGSLHNAPPPSHLHHSAPNLQTGQKMQQPPGRVLQPHYPRRNPDVPHAESHSLPFDMDQTALLKPHSGDNQPSVAAGNNGPTFTRSTSTPLPIEETTRDAAVNFHNGRPSHRPHLANSIRDTERVADDGNVGGQTAWEENALRDLEGQPQARRNAYDPRKASASHGQETGQAQGKILLGNGYSVQMNA